MALNGPSLPATLVSMPQEIPLPIVCLMRSIYTFNDNNVMSSYFQMCVQNSSYTWVYDATYDGTYAYKDRQWVSMETPAMVAKKVMVHCDLFYKTIF